MVHTGPKILLGMKKRGFGAGRWNGFGGKVNGDETIEQAAQRELCEEAGITACGIRKRGVLTFSFEGEIEILEVHVFSVKRFSGFPTESEEMRPQWFSKEDVPFSKMWPDDKFWFPILFIGKNFEGEFYFRGENEILRYNLEEK